jgi:uncharacterized protein
MRHLLDVNALIAYGFRRHVLHDQVASWMLSRMTDEFLTCSITELGFVRVLGNSRTYGMSVARARELLIALKADSGLIFGFVADGNDISFLPAWAIQSAQTTDGHLVQLAESNGAVLATLDKSIPGAYIIPMPSRP